jgi:hypothetical protein
MYLLVFMKNTSLDYISVNTIQVHITYVKFKRADNRNKTFNEVHLQWRLPPWRHSLALHLSYLKTLMGNVELPSLSTFIHFHLSGKFNIASVIIFWVLYCFFNAVPSQLQILKKFPQLVRKHLKCFRMSMMLLLKIHYLNRCLWYITILEIGNELCILRDVKIRTETYNPQASTIYVWYENWFWVLFLF